MSGDPEQEYFSDGISEDVITDLSKIAGLMVISRNSSFTYKGRSIDVRDIGRDLGVRSVLEGSIHRAGNRVRITAQLIDATNGAHLWADRYDRDLTDIFAVQDDVTRRIVDALKVTLSPAEKARLADSGTPNIDAYDCYLRGRELLGLNPKNRERFEQSTKLFMRALELDPSYSQAYAALSMAYNLDYQNRWGDNPDNSLQLAKHNAEQAIEKDPNEPFARLVASWAATSRTGRWIRNFSGSVSSASMLMSRRYAKRIGIGWFELADFNRHGVVLDQELDLLCEVGTEKVGPRYGRLVHARPCDECSAARTRTGRATRRCSHNSSMNSSACRSTRSAMCRVTLPKCNSDAAPTERAARLLEAVRSAEPPMRSSTRQS